MIFFWAMRVFVKTLLSCHEGGWTHKEFGGLKVKIDVWSCDVHTVNLGKESLDAGYNTMFSC